MSPACYQPLPPVTDKAGRWVRLFPGFPLGMKAPVTFEPLNVLVYPLVYPCGPLGGFNL